MNGVVSSLRGVEQASAGRFMAKQEDDQPEQEFGDGMPDEKLLFRHARRAARLRRLQELKAPEPILRQEEKLVNQTMRECLRRGFPPRALLLAAEREYEIMQKGGV
jgi:hypothetical protein